MRLHTGFLMAILALSVPVATYAEAEGKMTPTIWYLDTSVMINGTDLLGPIPSERKLCFAPEANKDDLRCFMAGHQNITKWAPTSIAFVPPKNAPPRGTVILLHPYYESECYIYQGEKKCQPTLVKKRVEMGNYLAHPHIAALIDTETGQTPTELVASRTYEIQGYRFGDTGNGIYAGVHMLSRDTIVRWTYDSILFSPSETLGQGTELFVHNGAGKGNAWIVGDGGHHVGQEEEAPGTEPDAGSGATVSGSGVSFVDIAEDDPLLPALTWAVNAGVVAGYDDGTFRPLRVLSRVEWLKLLIEASDIDVSSATGSTTYTDVDESAWYVPYIRAATEQRLAGGYDDGTFRPEEPVTLAEGLVMAYRAFAIPTLDPRGEEWYARYIEHAQDNTLLLSGENDPTQPLRRGGGVWLLWNLQQFQQRCPCCGRDS